MPDAKSFLYSEYIRLPAPEFSWLIDPIVPVGGKVLIYSESKVGKSFAALQLAAALSGTEPDWFGLTPNKTGPVIYVQLDTPSGIWKERIVDAVKEGELKPEQTYFADKETLGWPFDITDPACWATRRTECDRVKPVCVIVDVIREFHNGNEDKNEVMKPVIQALDSAVTPAALVLIGHSKKPGENPSNLINGWRGSNYVPGCADTIVKFSKSKGDGQTGVMLYEGRKAKRTRVKLQRRAQGTWELRGDDDKDDEKPRGNLSIEDAYIQVLAEAPNASVHARAVKLSELCGKGFDACKSHIRRSEGRK